MPSFENYEEEDEDKKLNSLTPEQKQAVYQSLSEKYSEAGDNSGVDAAEKRSKWSKMAAGLGEAFSGYSTAENGVAGIKLDNMRQDADKRVEQARADRKEKMNEVLKTDHMDRLEQDRGFEDKTRGRTEQGWADSDATKTLEDDPNSQESIMARDLAKKMMPSKDFSGMTATQLKRGLPVLEKMYGVEQGRLGREAAAQERGEYRADLKEERGLRETNRREDKAEIKDAKVEEKNLTLSTPYGLANTAQDAKAIKDTHEAKKSFDRKLQEMIDLRTKHGGGATFNREDVGRGKQLSKDLLLEYKNMVTLGVLSASDRDLVEAIIPPDPLEYNSPMAAIQGQDPILNKMKKFKEDNDFKFNESVKTRVRGGGQQPGAEKPKGSFHGSDLP